MNISAITNRWSNYLNSNSQASNAASNFNFSIQSQNQDDQKGSRLDPNSAAALFSGIMNQGILPIGNTDSTGSSDSSTVSAVTSTTDTNSSSSLSLEEFLAKVKNGTVTESDLSTMQSELMTPPPPPPMQGNNSSFDSSAWNKKLMESAAQSYEDNSIVIS